MTKSEIFKKAHSLAKEEMFKARNSSFLRNCKYSYFFKLALMTVYVSIKPVVMTARMEAELMTDGRIAV